MLRLCYVIISMVKRFQKAGMEGFFLLGGGRGGTSSYIYLHIPLVMNQYKPDVIGSLFIFVTPSCILSLIQ